MHGVTFRYQTLAKAVTPPVIDTTRGPVRARLCVVCPGDDFLSLYPERLASYGLVRCKLHMLRVASASAMPRFNAAVMSDLGLVRYLGYAELPGDRRTEAAARDRAAGQHLANGVHLIAVQSEDGSLVVGDSHHYDATPDPFGPDTVDELIMDEFRQVMAWPTPIIRERWIGTYASASDRLMLIDRPSETVRLVMITSGTGASTSFAIAEEVIDELARPGAERHDR